jgi:hypothetical protein
LSTEKRPKKRTPKSSRFGLNPIIIGLAVGALMLLLFICYRIYISERTLIPISIFAMIGGALFQTRRLTENWGIVLTTALLSFIISFMAFLPGKREHEYVFENHIEIWPFVFLIFYLLLIGLFAKEKVTPKLTEGITLIQSMAILYWIVDFGLLNTQSWFVMALLSIAVLVSLFSVFHAFTTLALTRTNRLTLSIWSTIIYVVFAVEHICIVFQNETIENTENVTGKILILLDYFLLGVSGVYIVQSYLMLVGFLPGKGSFFNSLYFKELKELKSDHIKRYSVEQTDISHSLFCVLFTGGIFYMNYVYQIVPKNIAIWTVFVSFPFILSSYEYLRIKK